MARTSKNLKRDWLADAIMTAAGLVLAVTPLALWASPSKPVFYITLTVCGIAYGVILLLAKTSGPEQPSEPTPPVRRT